MYKIKNEFNTFLMGATLEEAFKVLEDNVKREFWDLYEIETPNGVVQVNDCCFVSFLDCLNKFKETKKYFSSFDEAKKFVWDTFERPDIDFIHYVNY